MAFRKEVSLSSFFLLNWDVEQEKKKTILAHECD